MPELNDMNRKEIMQKMADSGTNREPLFMKYQTAIIMKSSEELEKCITLLSETINNSSKLIADKTEYSISELTKLINRNIITSNKLSGMIMALNWILAIATVIAAIAAVIQIFYNC